MHRMCPGALRAAHSKHQTQFVVQLVALCTRLCFVAFHVSTYYHEEYRARPLKVSPHSKLSCGRTHPSATQS